MKAIVYERYGPPEVLRIREVEKPTPKPNEVLIRVYTATVTSGDSRVRSLNVPAGMGLIARLVFGVRRPRQPILGSELSGVVEAVGSHVTKFHVGDEVFAFSDVKMGCYASYRCMAEDGALVAKPKSLTFEEAAALSFGGTTALDFLRRAKLQRGEHVLINGASGSVGTAAIQLAKHFGAAVTAVCSTANIEMVRSIGADSVIDYTKENFAKGGQKYDVIMDTVGNASYSRCKNCLSDGGRLLLVMAGLPAMLSAPFVSLLSNKRVVSGPTTVRAEDLHFLKELADAGEYKPVIDREFSFDEIVAAHHYVDSGRKRGNVIIRVYKNETARRL